MDYSVWIYPTRVSGKAYFRAAQGSSVWYGFETSIPVFLQVGARFAAGGVLSGDQSRPGREIASFSERGSVTDRSHECGRGDRPDSGYGGQSPAGIVLFRSPRNERIHFLDASSQVIEFDPQLRQQAQRWIQKIG